MASSSQHSAFPLRPYPSSLSGPSQQGAASTRAKPLNFGQSHAPAAREAARLERERLDRERQQQVAQKSTHQQSQAQSALSQLADEQRDEVNEAVSAHFDARMIPD